MQKNHPVLNQSGVIHLPCALLTVAIIASAFGILSLHLLQYRNLKRQLACDRCAGGMALELGRALTQMDDLNRQIEIGRAAVLAAKAYPPAEAAAKSALRAIAFYQQWTYRKHLALATAWSSGLLCKELQVLPISPSLPWLIEPPDDLGPRPMRWMGGPRWSRSYRVRQEPRASHAITWRDSEKGRVQSEWRKFADFR
jgi:hypothetical protein